MEFDWYIENFIRPNQLAFHTVALKLSRFFLLLLLIRNIRNFSFINSYISFIIMLIIISTLTHLLQKNTVLIQYVVRNLSYQTGIRQF